MKGTVVITGGTKGLGCEITLTFARAGYFALALYHADEAAAQQLREQLTAERLSGAVLRTDVSSPDPSIWARPEIQEAERLILIHNACAPFSPAPFHLAQWEDFDAALNVAVKGAWACTNALLRPMLKSKGVIVNILTSAVQGPAPKGFTPYLTAKHALRGFTLALASEYASRGLRVFSASPGYMDSALTAGWDERLRSAIRVGAPRVTTPPEAAARLLALVEDESIVGAGEDYEL